MAAWDLVHEDLQNVPFAEGWIAGRTPLYAERYLMQGIDRRVRGIDTIALVTHLGGARVNEGEVGNWRLQSLPSQSLLVPRRCATHWHYNGTVDFAVFYFPQAGQGESEQLERLAATASDPLQFSDSLVIASAQQLVTELDKGAGADEPYMDLLVEAMLRQTFRALTTAGSEAFSPRHVHFNRLHRVMPYIRLHLAEDLSAQTLADVAGVSIAHLRRLFVEATGVPISRYVRAARLDRARKLLQSTTIPIVLIADECGFSSQSHFTASFKAAYASTPAEYRAIVTKTG